MTTNTLPSGITRRQFMVGAAGLTFTVLIDANAALSSEERGGAALAPAPAGGSVKVNAWASIATDGAIYIANPAVEMGQGSQTAIPLIIAEEMDADWPRVRRVMMDNAADKWNVPLAELSTEPSTVVHAKSGRKLSYGEIAAFAQIPAV